MKCLISWLGSGYLISRYQSHLMEIIDTQNGKLLGIIPKYLFWYDVEIVGNYSKGVSKSLKVTWWDFWRLGCRVLKSQKGKEKECISRSGISERKFSEGDRNSRKFSNNLKYIKKNLFFLHFFELFYFQTSVRIKKNFSNSVPKMADLGFYDSLVVRNTEILKEIF